MNTEKKTVIPSEPSGGFSIIETVVAMVIIMIAMLGALQAINYSVLYNAGNATRAQNLAILQREVEMLRSAKFTPAGVDNFVPTGGVCNALAQRDITGGTKTPCTVTAPNGGSFLVSTWVDDNPSNNPLNGPATYDVDATTRIKEITVQVRLNSPTPGWQTSIPAQVVLRRTIGN